MFLKDKDPPHTGDCVRGIDDDRYVIPSNTQSEQAEQGKYPPGLIGDIAEYIFQQSPRPHASISLAGAIALLSGICGRAYNTHTGAGLNQYILVLAPTGMGKEAAASGIAKLIAAITPSVVSASDFKGPTFVSAAGLLKWLAEHPCFVSVVGEVGYLLKRLSASRITPNDAALLAILLDLYAKSGAGSVFDPLAYSDKEKQTKAIIAPSLTILGESVPGVVFEALSESVVLSGLLPRFLVIEATGARVDLVEGAGTVQPPSDLVQRLADLAAHCLSMGHNGTVQHVQASPEAASLLRDFDRWTTAQINAHNSEAQRELWNRAHLKALKLASVIAVGMDRFNPVIGPKCAEWAIALVVEQTNSLIAKFDAGEVGEIGGNEIKQQNELLKAIGQYLSEPIDRLGNYGGFTFDMHRDGVVTGTYLSRRLIKLKCFEDKIGATNALKRAIATLLEGDELREMPKLQMQAKYGSSPKAYVVANPTRFIKAIRGK